MAATGAPPHLRVVNPDATPEEVAAIVAAIGVVLLARTGEPHGTTPDAGTAVTGPSPA